MDRTRDLAQGLSRVENKLSNQEFVVLTLQPTVTAETFAANDVWFASTELPKAVVAGRGALIKSITVIDDDAQSIVGSLFFTDQSIATAASGAAEDNTHAENQTILGEVEIPAASYVALATSTIATVTGIDLVVQPANNETSLYIFGHTDGTPSYTAAALTIRIGLQRL
tara:strand:+ start:38 stop:544 length:507 start_codon:yes stop_codon:yes gene_type:complete